MGETYFHGTYRDRLDSIMKNGLGGASTSKGYSQSKSGNTYLAESPKAAREWAAYAESRWTPESLKMPPRTGGGMGVTFLQMTLWCLPLMGTC